MQKLFYSPEELAELLNISVDVIYDLLRSGDLQGQKWKRAWRISHQEVERYQQEGPAKVDGQEGQQC
jgi:excisionase family DNA binding protein